MPTEKIEKITFKKLIMTIGNLPSSYVESLSYYECMLWLCNYLENTVVPAVNNNGEAVEELQEKYAELKSYVEHYFDNLDVQEEIDTKLDEMAQDGTLADIIADYIQLKGVLAYNSVAQMKEATNLNDGSFAETFGFYSYNQGGGALYKIRKITNNDVVNDIDIIALHDETLIAELINDKNNILCYGVKLDDANNNNHTLINYVLSKEGYAYCNKNIALHNTLEIVTDNAKFEFLKITYSGNDTAVILNGQSIVINGTSIISTAGDGLRVGYSTLTHNCNITLSLIRANKNAVIMGGTAGVLNSYMNINRIEYKTHGIYFDLSSSYVGQVSLYNSIFADNSSETENYAIYMNCSDHGMTGLDLYNISLEGAKGGIYASTTKTTIQYFLEHLNIYGCRIAEFSILNNKKLLKFVCPSSGINVEGEIHFDRANLSAFDMSEYLSWGQTALKLYGVLRDATTSDHQLNSSPLVGLEGRLAGGYIRIEKPGYDYVSQNTGSISDYIIPTANNIVLTGTTNPNIKFTTSNYTLVGIYTIYISSADITSVTFIDSNGNTLRTISNLESSNAIIVNAQNKQLNVHVVKSLSYMINTA